MTRGPYRGKRALDLVLVAVAAIPVAVLLVPCAIAVACTSRGGVFFRQERVGRDGVTFRMWKLRTMLQGGHAKSAVPDRQRITRVGRVLRRLSLDELPQLLNVAAGEMSIVGPRPTLGYQVERYDQRQRGRLSVRPGVTGLAQIKGRNTLAWAARIELDLEYIECQSPLLDLKIIIGTVPAFLRGAGVEGHPVDDPIAARDPSP